MRTRAAHQNIYSTLLRGALRQQAALRQWHQFRAVVEHTRDVPYVVSVPDGIVRYIGPQVRRWGVAPEDVIGRSFLEFVALDDRNLVLASFSGALMQTDAFILRFNLRLPDGRQIPVEETGTATRRDGEVVQFIGTLREIRELLDKEAELARYRDHLEELVEERTTALREAEAAARRHAEDLRALSQAASVLIERMSEDELARYIAGQVRLLSGAAICTVSTFDLASETVIVRALAVEPAVLVAIEQLAGQAMTGVRFVVPADVRASMVRGMMTPLAGGLTELTFGQMPPPLCEALTRDLALGDIWGMPVLDRDELLGLVGICMPRGQALTNDTLITAFINQAGLAMRRQRISAELERERATLAAAVEMLPLPFWLVDMQSKPNANSAARAFWARTGLTDRRHVEYLDPRTHAALPQEERSIQRALRGEVISGRELIMLTADGAEVPVVTHAAPVSLNGEIVAAVGVIEDITPLKEADRAKDEFLATLSHELQTPLTSILSWSELARGTDDPEILDQALEVIFLNAQRQKALVAEMLDMSRLIYRKLVLEPHLLDLGYEAHLALMNFQQPADAQHITLALERPREPLPVMADPLRLQQCLGNLLQNSLKFTPAGGCVTLTCAEHAEMVELAVSDTGCGMTPAMLEQAFTPFRSGREAGHGGLGLGLALVRGIIALHQGTVTAESAGPGQGCVVRIRLPRHG